MGYHFKYQVLLIALAFHLGQTLKHNIGDVSASSFESESSSLKLKPQQSKTFSSHQVMHCPNDVLFRSPMVRNKKEEPEETRLELQNSDEHAELYWLNDQYGETKEFHVGTLAPKEYLRINTFVNDRFVVRSKNDQNVILLDVIVGVHDIHLPAGLKCKGAQGEGKYRANPPGILDDAASVRGWRNFSPCDITGFYIFPNGTERWMTDIPVGTTQPHFEITYITHNFVFKLNDGRVATRFTVKPETVPSCPRLVNDNSIQQRFINYQFNSTLTEAEIQFNAMIATAAAVNEGISAAQIEMEKVSNISHFTCPITTAGSAI